MNLQVRAFFHTQTSTLTYVIHDPLTLEAAVIDPVLDFDGASGRSGTSFADQVIEYVLATKLHLKWILETHAHADHLTGAQHVKARLGGQIAIGCGITQVQSTFQDIFNLGDSLNTDGRDFDHLFEEGDSFSLGQIEGRVLATPGHTNDSLSYVIDGNAFVGDSLFMPDAGTARCDFPGGSARTLFQSVQKLYALGDDVRIHVCHDYQPGGREMAYVATVREHKKANIHIKADTLEQDFVQKRESRDKTLDMPKLIIPSLQVNIRAGHWPAPETNGVVYLKLPINRLDS
ncbi:MBL fold metallo-hydrolase [Aliiglaciecola sp. CAU 1673]|uniref:MBL fold metallo-hydrolase n=1 Tax=Aliiglaciecola sp. CAU 1673 TaxID=3032595 RepID=UPI0023DB5695|nr:MBL fold metallo-hydrolase [Aliiglaciecola sp. CAU 1673]MDF2180084.1 MBL fold metallo-hydrolase [Aliiglaciecola sp. CAU 1673]